MFNLLRRGFKRPKTKSRKPNRSWHPRLGIEQLEERAMLSLVVEGANRPTTADANNPDSNNGGYVFDVSGRTVQISEEDIGQQGTWSMISGIEGGFSEGIDSLFDGFAPGGNNDINSPGVDDNELFGFQAPPNPAAFQVDLGAPTDITEIDVFTGHVKADGFTHNRRVFQVYTLSASLDGTNFTDIASVDTRPGSANAISASPTRAQQVISITDDAGLIGNYRFLRWTGNITYGNDGTFYREIDVHAASSPTGSEFRVNSFTDGNQNLHPSSPETIAMDAEGKFVIVWTSDGQDNSGRGVYARMFDASGVPRSDEFRVNTFAGGDQFDPAVALGPNGNFVISWTSADQDGSGNGVFAQRFDATGNPVGTEFRVNVATGGRQQSPSVAMDASGNFVIAWDNYNGTTTGDVYARRYSANGGPLTGEFRVNSTTNEEQWAASVAMDHDGDFVIVWQSRFQDGDRFGIYGQRYDNFGGRLGGEFRINSTTFGHQSDPAVDMDSEGNFVVTWIDDRLDGSGFGIFAQRYDKDGNPLGGEFQVNTYTPNFQRYTSVAMDAGGDFVIAWSSDGQDGSLFGVFAQRYSADGTKLGEEFQVNTVTANHQLNASVAINSMGAFAVAWDGNGPGDDRGVFARIFAEGSSETDISMTSAQQIDTKTIQYVYETTGISGDIEIGLFRSANDQWDAGDEQVPVNRVAETVARPGPHTT